MVRRMRRTARQRSEAELPPAGRPPAAGADRTPNPTHAPAKEVGKTVGCAGEPGIDWRLRLGKSMADGPGNGFSLRMCVDLGVDVGDMTLDGTAAQ